MRTTINFPGGLCCVFDGGEVVGDFDKQVADVVGSLMRDCVVTDGSGSQGRVPGDVGIAKLVGCLAGGSDVGADFLSRRVCQDGSQYELSGSFGERQCGGVGRSSTVVGEFEFGRGMDVVDDDGNVGSLVGDVGRVASGVCVENVEGTVRVDGRHSGVGVVKEEKKNNVPGAFGNSCHEKGDQNVIGKNVERNRGWRKAKKEKKQRKKNERPFMVKESWREKNSPFSLDELSRGQDIELRNSLAAKWKAENALAKLRAERQFEVLNSSDVQDEVKQHRTKLNATIERNMVSIEKTHATLRATGNVAGEFHGSAETVLTPDLSSGSISPDSSASMQEFRAVQKKNLDQEKKIEDLERKLALVTEKTGISGPHIDLYDQDFWTNNSVNNAILDEMYPNGYGMDGSYCNDGKVRVIPM